MSAATLNANCSSRVVDLAVSKKCHPDFLGPKPVQTEVPLSARTVIPTSRLLVLATPIPRKATTKFEEFQKRKLYELRQAYFCSSSTSSRMEKVATNKVMHSTNPFHQCPVIWTASRMVELSIPPARRLIRDTAYTFTVSPATQHVVASERLKELAKPKTHHL